MEVCSDPSCLIVPILMETPLSYPPSPLSLAMLVRPAPAPVRNPSAALSSTDSRRSDSPPREAALPPSESMESRRLPPRDRFVMRHGSKLHSYDRDKVPYPASYNREDLEL